MQEESFSKPCSLQKAGLYLKTFPVSELAQPIHSGTEKCSFVAPKMRSRGLDSEGWEEAELEAENETPIVPVQSKKQLLPFDKLPQLPEPAAEVVAVAIPALQSSLRPALTSVLSCPWLPQPLCLKLPVSAEEQNPALLA